MSTKEKSRRGPNIWVVRIGKGFGVKSERRSTPLTPVTTQRHAIPQARAFAVRNRSELIVQGRKGRIRFKNSYGPDPNPPRG